MSATQSWLRSSVGTTFSARFGKIGPSWSLSVVAMNRRRGRTVRPFSLHQPHDFLVVHGTAFAMQLGGHATIAVGGPLGAHRLDLLDKPCLVDRLDLRLGVEG